MLKEREGERVLDLYDTYKIVIAVNDGVWYLAVHISPFLL